MTSHAVTQAEARSQLQAALTPLNNGRHTFSTQLQPCNTVACASPINRSAASSFTAFAGKVRAIRMPSGQDSADAANLASAASHIATIYTTLARATSTSQYESIATGLQPALATVNSDYATVAKDLGGS